MVDISSQNNKINVTVSSSGNTANTNITPDYAQYYSEKSKEWAISNRIVDNTDYSSKYYANESKKQADISTAKATEVIESGNNAVSNIESARDNAIIDITNQESLSVDNVNTAGITQVANVNSAGTTQINLAKEQVTLATNQANIATEQATIATNKTSEVVASGNTALSNITTAKNNAITTITKQETTSKNNVIATGNEQVERVNLTGIDNRTPIFSKSEIGTNKSIYQNVYDLKHSTFDKSKFTVVGNPTITDDGVASGFSRGNYLMTNTFTIDATKPWYFQCKFTTDTLGTSQGLIAFSQYFYLVLSSDKHLSFRTTNTNQKNWINTAVLSEKAEYTVDCGYDGTYLYLNLHLPNGQILNYNRNVASTYIGTILQSASIGEYDNFMFTGSIDLKQFSITVDGKEVFSGNKTGIDTIKADNYDVVGSPVISDDGIASGFSSGNDLLTTYIFNPSNTWQIKGSFTTPETLVTSTLFAISDTIYTSRILINYYGSNYVLGFKLSSDNNSYFSELVGSYSLLPNTKYYIEWTFSGTQYTLRVSTDKVNWTTTANTNSTANIYTTSNSKIRMGKTKAQYEIFTGSIDLNAFKIYVDGNLVYQPCLKIPYTQSKTGSKIVDVAYRDRVIDLYEQEGQAGYYTIDEENKNFTLPMGEIYGMIEGKADKDMLNNPYSLFDSKYSDHELNNLSWLKSSGQWNAKTVYPTAYDKLLKVYNGTETVEGLSVKLSTETYTDYDFVLNTADETFRLPLLDGSEDLIGSGVVNYAVPTKDEQTYIATYNGQAQLNATTTAVNQFIRITNVTTGEISEMRSPLGGSANIVSIWVNRGDTFKVNGDVVTTIYSVQLFKAEGNGSLYYYVGETVQNANLIDAGRIGEQLAGKQDKCIHIIDTYINGTSGYRIWSDGYCEQWGEVSTTAARQSWGNITLTKIYKDINYNVFINPKSHVRNNTYLVFMNMGTARIISSNNFYAGAYGISDVDLNTGFWWKTCGYLAEGEY